MKDPIKAIKTAYANLLGTGISVNGSAVDFYIGESNKAGSTHYMVLNTSSSQSILNKHVFLHDVTVNIDVYSKIQNLSVDPYSSVDEICEQVMEAVVISPTSTGLNFTGLGFQIGSVSMDATSYEGVEDLGGTKLIKRTITFIQKLTQS